jgi:uncharacterized damage-inducible protein DinB
MGWDAYQDLLIQALAPLTAEQLGLRAAPHLRSIGENAAHIIGARASWFHIRMGEGDTEIATMADWDIPDAPERSAAELITGLEAIWQMIQSGLKRWTSADLADSFSRTRHGEEEHFSRQWIIWHVIEHDLHHGGEISLTLGMYNLAAPDL